jgi:polar amino acid transport system substrate-binding protein
MTKLTSEPGVLRVASAFPDPPFEVTADGGQTGFDRELMRLICDHLGLSLRPMPYSGDDFDGIFEGLENGSYDAVISGTTITPEPERMALFSPPYLQFNQGLAVNIRRNPKVKSSDDLRDGRRTPLAPHRRPAMATSLPHPTLTVREAKRAPSAQL